MAPTRELAIQIKVKIFCRVFIVWDLNTRQMEKCQLYDFHGSGSEFYAEVVQIVNYIFENIKTFDPRW